MTENFADPISTEDAIFRSEYFLADDNVKLNVMSWQPKNQNKQLPIIFVAGWVSVVQGWADLIREASKTHPVYYIETREKKSAEISKRNLLPEDFSIARMANDISKVCSNLPIKMEKSVIVGSSLGATSILESMKNQGLSPKGAFLISPNSEFKAPKALKPVVYLPSVFYHLIKYPLLWYLKAFRVDGKKEPEQLKRYQETLLSADPLRIKLSARSVLQYEIWSCLDTITSPVGLAYAHTDKLHSSDNILRMKKLLKNARLVKCKSNKYLHSADLVSDIDSFVQSL